MQCAFIVWSLKNQTPDVWKLIQKNRLNINDLIKHRADTSTFSS